MKYILQIDTSAEKGVVALSGDGQLLGQRVNADTRNHAASVNLLIGELLEEAGISLDELSALAVIGGPGSYTGLRIGLATAKGICYVLEKPLILQSRLELLNAQMRMRDQGARSYYLTLLPAREKEFFMCLYNNEGQQLRAPGHVYERELSAVVEACKGPVLISGVSTQAIADITKGRNVEFTESEELDPVFWSGESLKDFDCNKFVNLANAEPFYLKQVYTHKPL